MFGAGSRWHEFRVLSSTRPSGSSAIELSLGRIFDVAKSNSAAPARCQWRPWSSERMQAEESCSPADNRKKISSPSS